MLFMIRETVTSSDLRSVGYDESAFVLEIEFHNGGIYHYFEVPYSVYAALMAAGSKGRYFNAQIRKVYRCQRIA